MAKSTEPTAPERAYQDIKRRLFSGRFRLRQRLDVQAIAADLGVSTTPVREALLRLAHERLVGFRPAHGFSVLLWSEAGLRDLYCWRAQLADLALMTFNADRQAAVRPALSYPDRVAALLCELLNAMHSELGIATLNADDRLYVARLAELEVWPGACDDLHPIEEAIDRRDAERLKSALDAYHAKRIAMAKDIRQCAALLGLTSNGV